MRADGEPQSKGFETVTDHQNKGQNHQAVERHPPVEWIQITVNGHKNNGSDERTEIELNTRSKEKFFPNACADREKNAIQNGEFHVFHHRFHPNGKVLKHLCSHHQQSDEGVQNTNLNAECERHRVEGIKLENFPRRDPFGIP